ncbi:hypothetical protein CXZ10_01890 [Pleomorphomonas diazotrophica]|uniref:Flagellin n=1 Tax=Pleomorphomonas diazotrophica TaxID=1166257 RepID=A0A1I4R6D4_9HYPH|nr:flagellin [Pleomorphomonas diazotrophica]PKR90165.1 hypothetical protein CXZ10_01890 [Pleomorphomonas diazotrophica]SFM47817.1 Flagellin FlgL [Pleomorphomonas diazotrophica]
MSEINLTKAVRQNLLTLQGTASMMAKTQNKLATGNKVNSALDNPSNYFTAASLNSRASDLGNLMDSMASGIKTIEAADNGLSSITKTLESMQSTLRQARQDKSFETASFSLDPANVALGSSPQLKFVGGAFGTTTPAVDLTTTGSGQAVTGNVAYAAPVAATKASASGNVNLLTNAGGVTGGSLSITYAGKTVTSTIGAFAAAADARSVATTIQQAIDGSDLAGKLTATIDGSNQLKIEATDTQNSDITFGGTAGLAAELVGAGASGAASDAVAAAGVNHKGHSGKTEFSVNGTAISLDTTTGSNLTTAVDNINKTLAASGSKFKAVASAGKLAIQAATTDAGSLQITGNDADIFSATADVTSVAGAATSGLNLLKTVDTLVSEINSGSGTTGLVKASNDNGKLRVQNLSTQDLQIQGTNSSGKITGSNSNSSTVDGNSVRSGLADQFNELRDQLDKLADDASFNGINLLRGDKLTITFNETGTSSIDILAKDGKSVDSTTLGVPTTLTAKDLDSDSDIDVTLGKVKTALNTVRSQSSAFGSNLSVVENRQNFSKSMINTLQTGAGNLTLADMNEEAANMVALQTRQSLATSSLSMANSADQNVLQLLR